MLRQKFFSISALFLLAHASVVPETKEWNDSDSLSPEQRLALEWALDLIGHGVGIYRNTAKELFLVQYGLPVSGLVSRQTLLLDGAGQLISALSPVIADSLKKPCVPIPPTAKVDKSLERTGLNVEDITPLPTAQAQECEEQTKSPKGAEVLSDLLGKLPLLNN